MMEFIWNLYEVTSATIANILRGKAGVYPLVYNTNGKTYVGSSSDLRRRFLAYMNPSYIISELLRGESRICRALLKYGPAGFSFKILEIVPLDSSLSDAEQNSALLKVEQKYIDLLQPEYNILKRAGSAKGHKLSEETKARMSASKKGKPSRRKGGTHTNESKLLIKNNNAMSIKVFSPGGPSPGSHIFSPPPPQREGGEECGRVKDTATSPRGGRPALYGAAERRGPGGV